MKRTIAVIFLSLITIAVELFGLSPVPESDYRKYSDITVMNSDLTVYGRTYTEKEWWRSQPVITLNYEGDERYLEVVQAAIKRCGYLMGQGEGMNLSVRLIEERFLYVNASYQNKRFDNMQSLILLDQDIETQLYKLLSNEFGDFRKKLPKLVLIKCDDQVLSEAELLYTGPEYCLFRTFEDQMSIKYQNHVEHLDLPFTPIVFFDLSELSFTLRVKSAEKVEFLLDGEVYSAPISLDVNSGVHEFVFGNEVKYLYVIEDMEMTLDLNQISSGIAVQVDAEAFIRLYRDGVLLRNFKGTSLEFETIAGNYRLIVSKEGYADYDESFTLLPGETYEKSVKLRGWPGSQAFKIELSGEFDTLLQNDFCYVVSGVNHSLIIRKTGYETDYLPGKVQVLTDHYLITSDTVYDASLEKRYVSETAVVNAVETDRGLWLFLADKRIRSIDTYKWNEFWVRTTDYMPLELIKEDKYVAIYDVFSRIVLIDSEYGYTELLSDRQANTEGILRIVSDDEAVSVYLKGNGKKISYYFGSMKYDITGVSTENEAEKVIYDDGWFYQAGEALFKTEAEPVLKLNDGDLCVFVDQYTVTGFFLK